MIPFVKIVQPLDDDRFMANKEAVSLGTHKVPHLSMELPLTQPYTVGHVLGQISWTTFNH